MKLLCKKIKSPTCLEIFQSTEEDIAYCPRAFSEALKCHSSTENVFFEKTFSGMVEW